LGLSSSDLSSYWKFGSDSPSCSYVHHSGKGGKGGKGGSSSSSGGSSNGGGGGDDDDSYGGDDDDYGGQADGYNDDGGDEGAQGDDGVANNNDDGYYEDKIEAADDDYNNGGNNAQNDDRAGDDDMINGDDANNGNNDDENYNEDNANNDDGGGNDEADDDDDYYNNGNDENNGGNNNNVNNNNGGNDDNFNANGGNGGKMDDDDSVGGNDDDYGDEVVTNDDFGNVYGDDDGYQADDAYQGDDAQQGNNGNYDDDGGSSYDPFDDFDIEQCDTYENLWLWDLSLTCDSEGELNKCECIFTEELIEQGLLDCEDMDVCPSSCPICKSCLELVGCASSVTTDRVGATQSWLFFIAVTLGTMACGAMYYIRRRRSRQITEAHLEHHLIGYDGSSDESAHSEQCSEPVWLAPELPVAQFGPSLSLSKSEGSIQADSSFPDFLPSINLIGSKEDAREENGVWLAPID